jgi:hypothetical protein
MAAKHAMDIIFIGNNMLLLNTILQLKPIGSLSSNFECTFLHPFCGKVGYLNPCLEFVLMEGAILLH